MTTSVMNTAITERGHVLAQAQRPPRPAQNQPPGPRHAEFVICDQSIEAAFKLIKARLQVENWSGILPHTVEQDFYASLLRANCAAALVMAARPDDAAVAANAGLDARGWRQRLNRTLALKCLRHYLPRLLLALDPQAVIDRLIKRLRSPAAVERTRPDRRAPRCKRVRITDFHFAYKAA